MLELKAEGFKSQIKELYRQQRVTENLKHTSKTFSFVFWEANFQNSKEKELEQRNNRSRETN
jgi:hypothetical protein